MLGFSFPPSEYGGLACFGLVPLLVVLAEIHNVRSSLKYIYLALLVFHIITLNWTGGYAHGNDVYMMIAGGVTMTGHPLFYFIPLGAYVFIKKYFGETFALIALPFIWVGYEYTHSLSEWSFPWLTIGNSQSFDIARIQFISITGIYGLSLWILVINVLAYFLLIGIREKKKWSSLHLVGPAIGLFVVYVFPTVYGNAILSRAPSPGELAKEHQPVTVGMIQSNIDPWDKWTISGYEAIEIYLGMTRDLLGSTSEKVPDVVLWPETAVPYYLLTEANRSTLDYLRTEIDSLGIPILTGLPQAVYYEDSTLAPPSAKRLRHTGERYDAFNAAAFIQPGVKEIPWYGKMKMVPVAERVPYADAFYFLGFLQWGVGIGGWQIGRDSVIFQEQNSGARFSSMICYESVYPAFVASFVKKGAEFISIITIDSWWDRMSGAYQHQQFAIFRAVENRRWIARCAVGGISCFIDPYGRVYDKTELFTRRTLSRTIGRSTDLSIYTAHGDLLAESCLLIGGMFFAAAVGMKFKQKKRMLSWQSDS